ncbi:MAG: DUF423 domain-containing protein [Flavobacterium sp.]|nr:MAG: DUF423 domain-containing protein [Flavobacterium sp.]
MDKRVISSAAILGAIAIILGAFGAHALKKVLTIDQLATFETGVKYQLYHALFLLFLGTSQMVTEKAKKAILYLVLVGVLFFSGSIYLLATNGLLGIDFRVIGFITPIGGLLLIGAWIYLFATILKKKS